MGAKSKIDITEFTQVKMMHQNAFQCFLFFLEKKIGPVFSFSLFHELISRSLENAKAQLRQEIEGLASESEQTRNKIVNQISLVTLFVVVNTHASMPFKKAIKQYD